VLRALDLLPVLDQLLPEPPPSPMAALKLAGRERRRAAPQTRRDASPRSVNQNSPPSPGAWTPPDEPED